MVNVDWKDLVAGMNRSPREWWKVKTSTDILWDFTVQCDQKIEARRPDIVFIDKKETEVVLIDVGSNYQTS